MARILVLYGTTDGHTGRVAAAVAATLEMSGVEVDLVEAGTRDPQPVGYAGIIVAASVHAGRYQRSVRRWVRKHADDLRGKPTALVSVSLGVLQRDPKVQHHVAAIVDTFVRTTRWQPTVVQNVAGALRYTRYNIIKRWIMREIARKAGGETDTTQDYEYTNWAELRAFASRFAQLVSPRETSRPPSPDSRFPSAEPRVPSPDSALHLTIQ